MRALVPAFVPTGSLVDMLPGRMRCSPSRGGAAGGAGRSARREVLALVRDRPRLIHFLGLALLAGGPAILGTWIGAFVYSPFWTTIFLAIGIGAILQVIVEVGRLIWRSQRNAGEPALTWATFGGLAAGIAVMYLTALLVAA